MKKTVKKTKKRNSARRMATRARAKHTVKKRAHGAKIMKRRTHVAKRAARAAKVSRKVKRRISVRRRIKAAGPEVSHGDENAARIREIIEGAGFADFISKNVGKKAIDVIQLISTPKTDEKVAADLNMKINEIRRMLNVLDSYGVARYDTNKDNKGWLTFEWYLNMEKLAELSEAIKNRKPESSYKLQEGCNDFFFCAKCYEDQKVVLPFDTAFEHKFRCDNCGGKLTLLSRTEAVRLFEKEAAAV